MSTEQEYDRGIANTQNMTAVILSALFHLPHYQSNTIRQISFCVSQCTKVLSQIASEYH